MKKIKLTQDKYALVDDEDFESLSRFKWHAAKRGYGFYAQRHLGGEIIQMHRLILGAEKGQCVDHINRDTLDNRRENLRICNHSENARNRVKSKDNSSGYKGVSWHKKTKKWVVQIMHKGVVFHLGLVENPHDGAIVYNTAAKKLHGVFARLNTI